MKELTQVRENLMTRAGYSPYCGAERCGGNWPRTSWNGKQFRCGSCGWTSEFPADFLQRYRAQWNLGELKC